MHFPVGALHRLCGFCRFEITKWGTELCGFSTFGAYFIHHSPLFALFRDRLEDPTSVEYPVVEVSFYFIYI